MKGLSNKEMEVVSYLEFEKKYFFTRDDLTKYLASYNQMRHTLNKLIQKGRVISLGRSKLLEAYRSDTYESRSLHYKKTWHKKVSYYYNHFQKNNSRKDQ